MQIKQSLKKFWEFLKEDSWQSWVVSLILLIIFVKFIFFPTLTFVTGSSLPLVVVESCSMYHGTNFDNWWDSNGAWYESNGISKEQFQSFGLKNGLNKGDILLVTRDPDPKLGDIIIFNAGSAHPLIHRLVSLSPLATKGDHNSAQLTPQNSGLDETNISKNSIVGQAKFKVIPLLGWVKLIWFEPFRNSQERGFCK